MGICGWARGPCPGRERSGIGRRRSWPILARGAEPRPIAVREELVKEREFAPDLGAVLTGQARDVGEQGVGTFPRGYSLADGV